MKNNIWNILQTVFLGILVLSVGFNTLLRIFDAANPEKYEYKVEFINDENVHGFNKLGEEGWEIIGSRRATSNKGGEFGYELILKK